MGLPRGRWVSQGAGGALRGCGAVPVPSWQGQNEGEVSPGWLTRCCRPPCRRNQNYSDILHSLALGDKRLGGFDLTLRFTHLFWFGDLNYRLDMDIQVWGRAWGCQGLPPSPVPAPLSPQEILNYISRKELEPLLKVDQLNLEKEKHKVFLRFGEDWGAPGGSGGATPAVGTVLTHCCPCR